MLHTVSIRSWGQISEIVYISMDRFPADNVNQKFYPPPTFTGNISLTTEKKNKNSTHVLYVHIYGKLHFIQLSNSAQT